jgi:hypothetical protein
MAESYMKKFMDDNFPEFTYQKKIKRYSLDWYLNYNKFDVIIECDEKAHESYDFCTELFRMVNIKEFLNKPVIFIRFCPDTFHRGIWNFLKYVVDGRFEKIKKLLEEEILNKEMMDTNIRVIYMFYGRFCMNNNKVRDWNVKNKSELLQLLKDNTALSEKEILEYKISKNKKHLRKLYEYVIS